VVERTIQFSTFCRHQHPPEPYVHQLIDLELPDRIQYADIGIIRVSSRCVERAVKTIGIELKTDKLVDLSVDINTSVVDPKCVAVLCTARRPIFDHIETCTQSHSEGYPLVIVYLDHATRV